MMLRRSGQILTLHRAMAQPVEQVVFERKFADYGNHGSLLCAHKRRGFGRAGGSKPLQGNVSMLLAGIYVLFVFQ